MHWSENRSGGAIAASFNIILAVLHKYSSSLKESHLPPFVSCHWKRNVELVQ